MYRPPIPSEARLDLAGQGMRPIRSSKTEIAWLQGPGPADLWTWSEGDQVKEQELTFFGRTIVHRPPSTLMTGLCMEGAGGAYIGKAGFLYFDTHPDPNTLEAGLRILRAIPEAHRGAHVLRLEGALLQALPAKG